MLTKKANKEKKIILDFLLDSWRTFAFNVKICYAWSFFRTKLDLITQSILFN